MVKISTIARAAGVSPAVVSRVMNADSSLRVRDATRERVLRIAREMDYAPNIAARSLRSSCSRLLALVFHDLANPVHAEIVEGARRAASRRQMAVLIEDARDAGRGDSYIGQLVGGGGVDGLILQGAGTSLDRTLARAARRHMPIVLLQSGSVDNSTLISLEDEKSAFMATSCLLELGHRKIGFLGVNDGLEFSRRRRRGWLHALEEHCIAPPPCWFTDAGSAYAQGARGVGRLMEAAPGITAIVAANVVAAIGALARLSDLSIGVPRDVSLVAIHDTGPASFVRPPLSVVRLPLRMLGETAVKTACAPLTSRPAAITVSDPGPELILRGSTAAPECPGPG